MPTPEEAAYIAGAILPAARAARGAYRVAEAAGPVLKEGVKRAGEAYGKYRLKRDLRKQAVAKGMKATKTLADAAYKSATKQHGQAAIRAAERKHASEDLRNLLKTLENAPTGAGVSGADFVPMVGRRLGEVREAWENRKALRQQFEQRLATERAARAERRRKLGMKE